jgi:hypothetical protein
MDIVLTIRASIDFIEDDLGDPVAGDPLEGQMLDAAAEAVDEALTHAMNRGFNHGMSDITSIAINSVVARRG